MPLLSMQKCRKRQKWARLWARDFKSERGKSDNYQPKLSCKIIAAKGGNERSCEREILSLNKEKARGNTLAVSPLDFDNVQA